VDATLPTGHEAERNVAAGRGGPRIVILGAGMAGLCLAIRLKQAGFESFRIFEKADDVGGTWLHNTYPGAACDIPAHLYSFSFAPKADWTHKYARQPEILDYFRACADRFGIRPHITLGVGVVRAAYDEQAAVWRIVTDRGETVEADVVVSAVGQLDRPLVPDLPGLATFRGTKFHSARWNHEHDLAGRNVAVVGNAASAIQFLPHIAGRARTTYVFQRTPNWINRLGDYAYRPAVKRLFAKVPAAARLYRAWLFVNHEWRIIFFRAPSFLNSLLAYWIGWYMIRRIPRPMRGRLMPDYPAGCKRVLLSDAYLATLQRDDVRLIVEPIREVTPEGIVCDDGGAHRIDTIIFATGFEAARMPGPIEIRGRGGLSLHDAWRERPRTYLGLAAPGFPNFFWLYGPNTNLGHNSIIFMVECQTNYVVGILRQMQTAGVQAVEVRNEVVERFDRMLQSRLQHSVWNAGCTNWYKTPDGAIVNNWHGAALQYWLRTRRPDLSDFRRA